MSSVFIIAAEVDAFVCLGTPFIPELLSESPAKLFRFFDWKSEIPMKVLK